MASNIHVSGPAFIYIGAMDERIGANAQFLGVGETEPDIVTIPEWEPTHTQMSGTKVPMDVGFALEHALVAYELTRWDEVTLEGLRNPPNHPLFTNIGASVAGTFPFGELGTQVATEGVALTVFIRFPYAQNLNIPKPVYAADRPGYRFPFTYFKGPRRERNGTRAKKENVVFHHLPLYFPASCGHVLYDEIGLLDLPKPDSQNLG